MAEIIMRGRRPGSTTQYRSEVKYSRLRLREQLDKDTHGKPKPAEGTPTLGGVTADQLDKSAQRGTAGIDRSQPSGDKE